MNNRLFKLPALACAAVLTVGCSFDMYEHPTACKGTSDCGEGYYCHQNFCVQQGATGGAGGAGGSDDGGSMNGGTGGHSGAGGTSGTGGSSGTGGTAGLDGGQPPNDAGDPPDASVDASQDSHVPVPPYAPCTGNGDCNAGETCRKTGSFGVCAESCSGASTCPAAPPGGDATVECDNNQCRIDCSKNRGDTPTCPTGMSCEQDPPSDPLQPWNPGPDTCYP